VLGQVGLQVLRWGVALVDVVIVSYNSATTLRDCVEGFLSSGDVNVIVVDNASQDESLAVVADLPVHVIPLPTNCGFAFGCNRGWQAGSAPAVLFLNPDARIDPGSLRRLVAGLDANSSVGLVAPRIAGEDGSLEFSLRRFPRLRSTYARALFLHRLFPRAAWSDEVVRAPSTYERQRAAEWVSGACVLVRRAALECVGGWDEGFFLYAEDVDLCRRLWRAGYEVRYDPAARAVHVGGASAPRDRLLPTLAASRIRYARIHRGRTAALLERVGIAFGELTHMALTTKGRAARSGHLRALLLACSRHPASHSVSPDSVPTTVEAGVPSD
jgi:N-acetylglucosaminyl-diphospho-decaprenol L-rhamnosyltransferase